MSHSEPTWVALITTTAISVATILGTGILGLPVSLYKTGLWPFLLTFTLTLFAQVGVVVAMTELLQHAYMHPGAQSNGYPLGTQGSNNVYSRIGADSSRKSAIEEDAQMGLRAVPSLHTLSKRFLTSRVLQLIFEAFVLMHFVSIMSSYSLAATQAYSRLVPGLSEFSASLSTVLFTVSASLVIVFCAALLLPTLTAATFMKGTLLALLIVVVLGMGMTIHEKPTTSWGPEIIETFLVGVIALSGIVNLMPVTFEVCVKSCTTDRSNPPMNKEFVKLYRRATVLGIVICYMLNVLWCIGILLCVPQHASITSSRVGRSAPSTTSSLMHGEFGVLLVFQNAMDGVSSIRSALNENGAENTLAAAEAQGFISTMPLIQVLENRGKKGSKSLALLVDIFIATSITVSFFLQGIGLKHTLDGQIDSGLPEWMAGWKKLLVRAGNYSIWYGAVLLIALFNPQGFIKILAGITSMCLNIEAGIFIAYMLVESRYQRQRAMLDIPNPLSRMQALFILAFIGSFFSLSVLIDAILYLPKTFGS